MTASELQENIYLYMLKNNKHIPNSFDDATCIIENMSYNCGDILRVHLSLNCPSFIITDDRTELTKST